MQLGTLPCRSHDLPADVTRQVAALMRTLGLEYGGLDFRLTAEGEYVFFEINTAGEFMYLQERTGQPLAEAMAAHLAAGAPPPPRMTAAVATLRAGG